MDYVSNERLLDKIMLSDKPLPFYKTVQSDQLPQYHFKQTVVKIKRYTTVTIEIKIWHTKADKEAHTKTKGSNWFPFLCQWQLHVKQNYELQERFSTLNFFTLFSLLSFQETLILQADLTCLQNYFPPGRVLWGCLSALL